MISINEVVFYGNTRCLKITNEIIDLIASLDIGPRILHFSLADKENMFYLNKKQLKETVPEDAFLLYGGHRLWTAPEDLQKTYLPDNDPVDYEITESTIRLSRKFNKPIQILKEMEIQMEPDKPLVKIIHRIKNLGNEPQIYSPWAITMMAPGGRAFIPLPQRGPHTGNLLPNGHLIFWAYTNLADPRLNYGFDYLSIQQKISSNSPLKIGLSTDSGWLAYLNQGNLFAKQVRVVPEAIYPDRGSVYQVYTEDNFLELESLGPLVDLEPGSSTTLEERWVLLDSIQPAETDDQNLENIRSLLSGFFTA